MNRLIKSLLVLCIVVLLPGCNKQNSRKRIQLTKLSPFHYINTDNHITLKAKKLTPSDYHKIFKNKGQWLTHNEEPLALVHLSIVNKTQFPIILDKNNLSIPTFDYEAVTQGLQNPLTHTLSPYALGSSAQFFKNMGTLYTVGSCIVLGTSVAIFGPVAALVAVPLAALGIPLAITIEGIHSAKKHTKIWQEMKGLLLSQPTTIGTKQKFDTLIAVRECDLASSFTVTLSTENIFKKTQYTFEINLENENEK